MIKKLLSITGILVISSISLKAQVSTGFTNPNDYQYLLDYRLPKWGYKNFYLGTSSFGLNGLNTNSKIDYTNPSTLDPQSERSSNAYSFNIRPTFEFYKESEQRILSINAVAFLAQNQSKFKQEQDNGVSGFEQKSIIQSQNYQQLISIENNYYLTNQTFIVSNFYSEIQLSKQVRDIKNNGNPAIDSESLNRDLMIRPEIGVGLGRIRNVTPVIRALRLNERYKSLGYNSFNEEQVLESAAYFSKVQGYQATKDRFLKSFWGDLNTAIDGRLDQVGAYDIFYLNDVFNESLGSRFEGYEVAITFDYLYYNMLTKQNDELTNIENRTSVTSRAASINLSYIQFKNLNLYHQIAVNARNDVLLPLESQNTFDWVNETTLEAEWLWNFADVFQLNSAFANNLTYFEHEGNNVNKDYKFASRLSSNFYYFIENKLALNVGLAVSYTSELFENSSQKRTIDQFQWGVNSGISYYFGRKLF